MGYRSDSIAVSRDMGPLRHTCSSNRHLQGWFAERKRRCWLVDVIMRQSNVQVLFIKVWEGARASARPPFSCDQERRTSTFSSTLRSTFPSTSPSDFQGLGFGTSGASQANGNKRIQKIAVDWCRRNHETCLWTHT